MNVAQFPRQPYPLTLRSSPQRVIYAVNSSFPSRKPRPSSLRGYRSFRKDLKDTMQHAALINIVAAVNEDLHYPSTSKRTSVYAPSAIRSNVTLISNFLLPPHEKTVSIPPSRHRMFEMPDEIVQRKPVYYKHSRDLEVRTQSHIRLFEDSEAYTLKVQKQEIVKRPKPSVDKIIKNLPTKPQILDASSTDGEGKKNQDDRSSTGSRGRSSRASSAVRRLGTLKKHEERKVCDIHKCEAVDLMDKREEEDPAKQILDDSRKLIPTSTLTIPYLRTKTLPVIFPVKKSYTMIRTESRNARPPVVPLSHSLRRQTPEIMHKTSGIFPNCFGFDVLSIHNSRHKALSSVEKIVQEPDKQSNHTVPIRKISSAKSRSPRRLRSPASPRTSHGESDQSGVFITLSSSHPDAHCDSSYKARQALNEAVQRVMSGRRSFDSRGNVRTVSSAKSKKSCLTSRSSGVSDNLSGVRSLKKVQFISNEASAHSSEENSLEDELDSKPVPKGGSFILQTQTAEPKLRSFSPGLQHMSSRELLRLEKKILPANTPPPLDMKPNYFLTGSLITVTQFKRSDSELSSNTSTSINEGLSDNEGNDRLQAEDSDGNDLDKTLTEDGSVSKTSNDNDNDKIGFYKLVKALDKQPYEGFEHRKNRKSAGSSRSNESSKQKPTYVKVRLS